MARYKKKKLDQFLPSTPCTQEMRSKMAQVAEARGCSLAELQRDAFSLFLSSNYSKAIENTSQAIEMEVSPA